MVAPESVWPAERIAAMEALISIGLSGQQIADQLNLMFMTAYSRCAVIGKARRLGLSTRGFAVLNQPRKKRQTSAKPRVRGPRLVPTVTDAVSPPVALEPLHLSFENMVECDGCRWPYGDYPYTFCARPRIKSFNSQFQPLEKNDYKPYCQAHEEMSIGDGTHSERAATREIPRDAG